MYHCSPVVGEKYYLWLLFTVIRGPQSFEDLQTVDEDVYLSFCAACIALHLFEDDGEWV